MSVVDGNRLRQFPAPGARFIQHRGDTIDITLELSSAEAGTAWLRTNIGHALKRRNEIIRHVEKDEPILAHDWVDVEMTRLDDRRFTVTLPLLETGRFEAKAFFLPKGSDTSVWPEGDNTIIKVEPAEYCASNTVYTAFVRQFGPNKGHRSTSPEQEAIVRALDSSGYTVIPRSGTFRDLIKELDFIIGKLRCRIIQLLPIHPTPTVYGKMGRFGSPFAALDFLDIDPSLAEFDKKTTPLEQFVELADAVHRRSARLFIDIPVNHTGWASRIQTHHPEWFARASDKTFQSPSAWGVVWEDLSKLNYDNPGLQKYMADVFLYWCSKGVDGFRCDAGYMLPFGAWEYIVARVRMHYPDTIFMLEGLGGSAEVVDRLLDGANMDWAYSELFQNYDRNQIESYLPGCIRTSKTKGLLIHFAETHDNNRLAAKSHTYSRLRTALCALCSDNGAFGITNGVEWFAREKIVVHEAASLNWGSKSNQVAQITNLHAILEIHPAFHPGAELSLIHEGHHNSIALLREVEGSPSSTVLVLANLNDTSHGTVSWKLSAFTPLAQGMYDLLTGRQVHFAIEGDRAACHLAEGEVLCLSGSPSAVQAVQKAAQRDTRLPDRVRNQCLRAKALDVYCRFKKKPDLKDLDTDMLATLLASNPRQFCQDNASDTAFPGVVSWQWPGDLRRIVMVPPRHFLLVRAEHPFVVTMRDASGVILKETSLPADDGTHFTVILPMETPERHTEYSIEMAVHEKTVTTRNSQRILYLPSSTSVVVDRTVDRADAISRDNYAILTNGIGGMAQVRAAWGEIRSKYDAVLAGNLNPKYPVDRTVMLTRFRGWLVYRGYSAEINRDCLRSFSATLRGTAVWRFDVPSGMGRQIDLEIGLMMKEGRNAVMMRIERKLAGSDPGRLDNTEPVKLILRPGIENRSCHEVTKAYTGPESSWPGAVTANERGFTFAPGDDRKLIVQVGTGAFHAAGEWQYMIGTPLDAERGLDASTDIFSPGYFEIPLMAGEMTVLTAEIVDRFETPMALGHFPETAELQVEKTSPPNKALFAAMNQFIARREKDKTIIAGYPWFLDWGRDTLICLRGLIAGGHKGDAHSILRQFARFEEGGKLPNLMHGEHASNWDTSDAPLWFIVACADIAASEKNNDFLDSQCEHRTIRDVVLSIARSYIKGTNNGIRMDKESGLIFSPAHFTWMDTNYPAGTPRQGYPIEIQALWHAALRFLSRIDSACDWADQAAKVRKSISTLYPISGGGYLADCRHASPGQTAVEAVADDALRPNQLLAVTLGAVTDNNMCMDILAACEELLVPGGIRSLADRPVSQPLPIHRNGVLLNNPSLPYWGQYTGDEDTRRKPAYHNGTAWTWLMPSYCEALYMTGGEPSRTTALSLLSSFARVMNLGCLGQLPEILDGDSPHKLRGCGAQAWSVTEFYRVLAILSRLS